MLVKHLYFVFCIRYGQRSQMDCFHTNLIDRAYLLPQRPYFTNCSLYDEFRYVMFSMPTSIPVSISTMNYLHGKQYQLISMYPASKIKIKRKLFKNSLRRVIRKHDHVLHLNQVPFLEPQDYSIPLSRQQTLGSN